MKRFVIRKYVMANSLVEALQKEKKIVAEDGWLDEKQPEPEEKPSQIGFNIEGDGYYYSPYLKRKKRKQNKK